MTGRDVRLFGAMIACALVAQATTAAALPKPRYAVDGADTHAKKHASKPDLAGGPEGRQGTYTSSRTAIRCRASRTNSACRRKIWPMPTTCTATC